jgi:threonine dehydrogenase-like Zn-dependent dehydrogenase
MLTAGDRTVSLFTICCGECDKCRRGYLSFRERRDRGTRPFAVMMRTDKTIRTGRALVDRRTDDASKRIAGGEVDPTVVITTAGTNSATTT